MPRTKLLVIATTVIAVASCGQALSTNPRLGPPVSVAPPGDGAKAPAPRANDEPPEPLTCDDWVTGISDFFPGAKGAVPNILAATRATPVVTHEPNDTVEQTMNTTRIVRDGEVIFIGEWQLADDGTWLLSQYSACTDFIPSS